MLVEVNGDICNQFWEEEGRHGRCTGLKVGGCNEEIREETLKNEERKKAKRAIAVKPGLLSRPNEHLILQTMSEARRAKK